MENIAANRFSAAAKTIMDKVDKPAARHQIMAQNINLLDDGSEEDLHVRGTTVYDTAFQIARRLNSLYDVSTSDQSSDPGALEHSPAFMQRSADDARKGGVDI